MTHALDLTDLTPRAAADLVSTEADVAWARRFVDELDRRVRSEPLERILELWGLSNAAAARMFGVSRQAFGKWLSGNGSLPSSDAKLRLWVAGPCSTSPRVATPLKC